MIPSDIFFDTNTIVFANNHAIAVHSGTVPGGPGGSYFPMESMKFTDLNIQPRIDFGFSYPEITIATNVGRQSTGIDKILSCPNGYAVAGIVGSSVSFGINRSNQLESRKNTSVQVGNLGLVCMPYGHPLLHAINFSRAGVVASGSIDVAILNPFFKISRSLNLGQVLTSEMVPLSVYMNEYLSTYNPEPREYVCGADIHNYRSRKRVSYQQNLTMCPPGYYVRGIQIAHANSIVSRISSIQCRSWDGMDFLWRETDVGRNNLPTNNFTTLDCGSGSVLSSIHLHSENTLQGVLHFGCRRGRPF